VDCHLEIWAGRQLMRPERTKAVIGNKGHDTWIYDTILRDESRIAAVAVGRRLQIQQLRVGR
jgi:hypothetical protein